jgi:CRP/FNR family transcriptional regulator, cyclic AMP receptor protein
VNDGSRALPVLGPKWPPSSLLARLEEADREELLGIGTRMVYPAQHVVIRHGNTEDYAVLLTKGLTKVMVDTENGREALLAIRAGGDLVGEMAALEGKPRSATVITCAQTTARLIPADVFHEFLARRPRVLFAITRMLSERLRFANEQRVAFAALTARARVARILVEVAHTYGRPTGDQQWDLGLALSNRDIASFAGVSLSSAEKAMQHVRRAGAVTQGNRRVFIADMAALENAAAETDRNP